MRRAWGKCRCLARERPKSGSERAGLLSRRERQAFFMASILICWIAFREKGRGSGEAGPLTL